MTVASTPALSRLLASVLLSAGLLLSSGGANAAINLPKLNVPKLPSLKRAAFTSCVNRVTDFVGGGAFAVGEYGTDGARSRNLRSEYVTMPVTPTYTPAGERARTPIKYLSKERPDGVMIGAGYDYVLTANGQESVQLNHVMIRAPFVATNGIARTHDPAAGIVRLSLGDIVYEGEAKISRGGLEFYVSAKHPTGIGYIQLRQADQAAFARAAASQTPFQVVVMDLNSRAELYRATVSMAPGLKQKALMDQAMADAAIPWGKGYDSPICHPEGVSID
ncbi:MAG: hypothetical protein JWM33_1367 [Caulobacteraceae bacterium]|nr:hypothetical protein [Caulobacteraceae bacterium]